jgi:hypothetical protein
MNKKLEELEENVKIITLPDKWKFVYSDKSNDDTTCRNLIQGKAIAIAYEHRNYELIYQIARSACNTES